MTVLDIRCFIKFCNLLIYNIHTYKYYVYTVPTKKTILYCHFSNPFIFYDTYYANFEFLEFNYLSIG